MSKLGRDCFLHPDCTTDDLLRKKYKRNYSETKQIAREVFQDFCSNTTIHGLQYVTSKHYWIRIFWSLMILTSVCFCSVLIFKTYIKWEETPVIVSFSEKSTPVWHIPFPAVTVCSETKTQKNIVSFTEIYRKLLETELENGTIFLTNSTSKSDKEFEYLQSLLQICSTSLVENIEKSKNEKLNTEIDYYQNLDEIIPEFNLTYPFCNWQNNLSSCLDLFKKGYTEQGICYTFNGLNPGDLFRENSFQYQHYFQHNENHQILNWTLESGYKFNNNVKSYPERVLGAGIRAGIFMTVQGFKQNLDYICRGPVQGFKIILHSPDDFPQVSKQFLRIPFNKEILVSVSPQMITTSEGLRHYSPERRQCFFSSERYLKFFKIYTQGNCEMECLANYTLTKCGCVHFSMPRLYETPVCDVSKIKCFYLAEHELLKNEFTEGLKHLKDDDESTSKCNCLPACTSLVYRTEISQADFDMTSLLLAYNDTSYIDENPGFQMSRLLVFFKENQFITSRRSELYGLIDFLANCGGIFGLFIGFSVLSIVDISYYVLRFILKAKYMKNKRKNENRRNSRDNKRNSLLDETSDENYI